MSKKSPGYVAAEDLRLGFERIERLKEEIKNLQDDVKDVFAEYKSKGFDTGTMKDVLKLRKMEPDDRRHKLSMVELYLSAVGMGDGSLSDMAREFLAERHRDPDAETAVDQEVPEFNAPAVPEKIGDQGDDDSPAPKPLTVDDAKRLGTEAQKAGRPITANPFPARDPRRAAWDEAWCQSGGSDGMDIPDYLKSDAALEKDRKAAAERAAKAAEEAIAIQTDADAALAEARRLVIREQNGSTAWLQKTLAVGYNVAARILETLESEGVVSAPNLQGRRDVLQKPDGDDGEE